MTKWGLLPHSPWRCVKANCIPSSAMADGQCELSQDIGCLDAPDFIPAGSSWKIEPSRHTDGFVTSRMICREWL